MRNLLPISIILLLGVFLIRAQSDGDEYESGYSLNRFPDNTSDNISASRSDLIFNHAYHIDDEGLECADCHGDVEDSASGLDNLLPDMDVCADCHDVEDTDECSSCHMDEEPSQDVLRIENYSPLFSHNVHISAELTCESCHEGIEVKESVDPLILPSMIACQDCHETKAVSTTCLTCHSADDSLKPPSHGLDFERIHSDFARSQALTIDGEKTCATCHETDYCQECHEGDNLDRLTHPLNWEFTHALEAQSFEVSCQSCHFDQQFCADCHAENLILPHTHTQGWAVQGTGGRHRIEAAIDLQTCISCHIDNAETVCGSCHTGSFEED